MIAASMRQAECVDVLLAYDTTYQKMNEALAALFHSHPRFPPSPGASSSSLHQHSSLKRCAALLLASGASPRLAWQVSSSCPLKSQELLSVVESIACIGMHVCASRQCLQPTFFTHLDID
jgi:hypothetical protein